MRDYTTMAGPLGVTHLLLFSKSSSGNTNLRLALTPRGPTIHFRVENYSLCKDVARALKHPRVCGKNRVTAPLLVMNNFLSSNAEEPSNRIPRHLESLTTSIFQSLFPPISPQTTPLSSIRRVMLLNRETPPLSKGHEEDSYVINLRHYAVTTKRAGISRRIRRLDLKKKQHRDQRDRTVPNLGRLSDISDYLDPAAGYTSASETELDTDAEVEVMETSAKKVLNKRELRQLSSGEKQPQSMSNSGVEKRAIRLVELGPRMRLKMMKVEEGVCGGKVMWHDFMIKSEAEARELDETWEKKRKRKELRRQEQEENVQIKRRERVMGRQTPGHGDNDDNAGDIRDCQDFTDNGGSDHYVES